MPPGGEALVALIEQGAAATAALIASIGALLTALIGGAVGLFMVGANRRRSDAGTVRDVTEAAVALVGPQRQELAEMRERVRTLEIQREADRGRILELEQHNSQLTRDLHEARERLTRDQARFQRQLNALMEDRLREGREDSAR